MAENDKVVGGGAPLICFMNWLSKKTLSTQLTNQIIRELNSKQRRWGWKAQDNSLPITVAGREQWDLYDWALVSISRALEEGNKWKTRELRKFSQFLSTFYPGLKQVSQTTQLDAQNNHKQISRKLVNIRDMAEDTEVGSKTRPTTRSAENLSASWTWLRMLRLMTMVRIVMMKRSKDHLFPRSRAGL